MREHDAHPPRRLAVDGKTVKGSRRADGRPVHLVGGVSPDSLRLVAQRPVDEKSDEITALRPMPPSRSTAWWSVMTSLDPVPDVTANGHTLLGIARGQWSIENGNHYVRDRSYDEDRCQVRDPHSSQCLATLRSLARFLAKQGAHRPRGPHHDTTPALNRFCDAHRNQTIRWLMAPRGPR